MATTIKLRRDTAANWTSVNPVLADGEPGYETDTKRIKIGDGSTAWNGLEYSFENTKSYADLASFPATGAARTIYIAEDTNLLYRWDGSAYVGVGGSSSGSSHEKGYFATESALTTAHPTGTDGDYAIVGATDTFWVWDSDTSAWVDSGINSGITEESFTSLTPSGGNVTLDLSKKLLKYTESGDVTWILSSVPATDGTWIIQVTLASASHTITLPANFFEEGEPKSTLPLTGESGDIKTIQFLKNGSNYEIFYPGTSGGTPDDGSVTDAKLATDVKVGSISALNTVFGLSGGGLLTNIQGFITNLFNRFSNITTANNKKVVFNNNGEFGQSTDFQYDDTSKELSVAPNATASIYTFSQSAASNSAGWKIPPSLAISVKWFSDNFRFGYLDDANGRWVFERPIRREIGGSIKQITGGSISSTSATAVVTETIAIPLGSVVTIESTVDSTVSGGATTSSRRIIGTFKNVGGTVTQIGTTTNIHTAASGSYDGTTTGIIDFNISGTDVQIRFRGAASVTSTVTSSTETKYSS